MTSVCLASLPAYGHLYPLMPLAEEMARQGADVSLAVGEPFLGRLPLPTVPGARAGVSMHDAAGLVFSRYPQVREDMANRWPAAFFGVANPLGTIDTLREQWSAHRPDLVVFEASHAGAALVADELGIPSVAVGLGHVFPPFLHLPEVARVFCGDRTPPDTPPWEVLQAVAGEPVTRWYVDPMPPPLQIGPVHLLPERLPLRPVPWFEPAQAADAQIPPKTDRPRVYLTLGTAFGAIEVIRAAIDGLAPLDVEVIVAAGPRADLAAFGELPSNVSIYRYVAQSELLPTVDVAVHHGGSGTMLAVAGLGIPQVIIPQGADQFVNAQAVARFGNGRVVPPKARTPQVIGATVAELLGSDTPQRSAAAALAAVIRDMPAPSEVASQLLHRCSSTRSRRVSGKA